MCLQIDKLITKEKGGMSGAGAPETGAVKVDNAGSGIRDPETSENGAVDHDRTTNDIQNLKLSKC